jgi:pyruvate dehydrogenase E2 component (dihydrolipoamide acetyltransferase)
VRPSVVSLLGIAALLLASGAASAAPKPRKAAEALLSEVSKGTQAGGVREAGAEARRALVRADRARLAGDHRHGVELEELALEWAEAARDRERLVVTSRRASELERKLSESEEKLEAARALIEQSGAQKARAQAQLKALEQPTAPAGAPKAAPQAPKPAPEAPKAPPAPAAKPKAAGT